MWVLRQHLDASRTLSRPSAGSTKAWLKCGFNPIMPSTPNAVAIFSPARMRSAPRFLSIWIPRMPWACLAGYLHRLLPAHIAWSRMIHDSCIDSPAQSSDTPAFWLLPKIEVRNPDLQCFFFSSRSFQKSTYGVINHRHILKLINEMEVHYKCTTAIDVIFHRPTWSPAI